MTRSCLLKKELSAEHWSISSLLTNLFVLLKMKHLSDFLLGPIVIYRTVQMLGKKIVSHLRHVQFKWLIPIRFCKTFWKWPSFMIGLYLFVRVHVQMYRYIYNESGLWETATSSLTHEAVSHWVAVSYWGALSTKKTTSMRRRVAKRHCTISLCCGSFRHTVS